MSVDMNDLSYWFPILEQSGVPVPKTYWFQTDIELWQLLDGKMPLRLDIFEAALKEQAKKVGYPLFLRTGQTSNKHDWKSSCYVTDESKLMDHVFNLIEFSANADMLGLSAKTWVVRELLQLETVFTVFRGEFPVNRERRYFMQDGVVLCHHPYWPSDAVEEGRPKDPKWHEKLMVLNYESPEEVDHLSRLAKGTSSVKGLAGHAWSLDFAKKLDGQWVAIDMALANRSFHWQDCPVGFQRWPDCLPAPRRDRDESLVGIVRKKS